MCTGAQRGQRASVPWHESHEPPDMSAGNWAWILSKSGVFLITQLSSPVTKDLHGQEGSKYSTCSSYVILRGGLCYVGE